MVLIIDNYDSFVYNLSRYVQELDQQVEVKRNDQITVKEVEALAPDAIIISPGPCAPDQAGVSLAIVSHFAGSIPMLGVCLGHQAIAQAFGATIARASHPRHGKASSIYHDQKALFHDMPSSFKATRYHSLSILPETFPHDKLMLTAQSDDGEIMALRHQQWPVYGVQFHPESVLTENGQGLICQFLRQVNKQRAH